ncbi:putative permease [Candidatus Terasakiella magnetica]|uniref:Putative permease n=1 Tax=Candidatus Terasakiella magnetica TaxID=1867952 RepID=A0A1C3RK27_9PROT|nr:permease [Candidatus Terasakiella magnetica]SCA57642.1 putative permease [Candidatus Terasakiella magnetica]
MDITGIIEFLQSPEGLEMLNQSASMFVELFLELTVLFLVISYSVALLNQKLPAEKIQRILGAQSGHGYFRAAALGAITPFCSCSTIPMLVGLLKARAGFGPTMTFLFTSPLLNPIIIALFIPVLGLKVTIAYGVLALSISLIAGVLLQHFGFEKYINPELLEDKPTSCCNSGCGSKPVKEPTLWQKAWVECWSLFKQMFPYMVIAMLIGALVHGFVPAEFFSQAAGPDNPAAIPTAAVIGIPLYVRVTTLLPLAGSFVAKGVSMGAIIALVIGSGGASLPEVILLKKLFYWPLLLAFLLVIFSMAVIGGFVFNLFII